MTEHSEAIAQIDKSADAAVDRAMSEFLNLAEGLRVLKTKVEAGKSDEDKKALADIEAKLETLDPTGKGKEAVAAKGHAKKHK